MIWIIKTKKIINRIENKPLFTKENFKLTTFLFAPYKQETSVKDKNKHVLVYLQCFMLLVIIFAIYSTTPKLAISTDILIRNFSNETPKTEIIEYEIIDEVKKIEGKIIFEEGNKAYISDSSYNLVIINSQYYSSTKISHDDVKSNNKTGLLDLLLNK